MKSSSSNTMVDRELFRRFTPGGTLPRIPNADSLSIKEVREMFNIPRSVKISKMEKLTDPVGEDEVVVNLYQLACGFPMPIDSFTCALLSAWGITIPQRILTISNTYLRFIRPEDVQRIITPVGRDWKVFSCECKNRNVEPRLDGDNRIQYFFNLPRSLYDVSLHENYVECSYDRELNANEVSLPVHASPLARRPRITIIDSDSESDECNPPKAMYLSDSHCSEESSLPIRFHRRPLASSRHCAKRSLVNGVFNSINVPDAMSGKVCTPLRRSNRANNKVRYTYSDPSFDDSASGFVVRLRKNCESESPVSSEDDEALRTSMQTNPQAWFLIFLKGSRAEDEHTDVHRVFSNHVDSSIIQSRRPPPLNSGPRCSFPDVLQLKKAMEENFSQLMSSFSLLNNQCSLRTSWNDRELSMAQEIVALKTKVDELTIVTKNQKEEISCTKKIIQLLS
ncbi:hypothetical protein MKW94_013472 [Papaver nudicaule]|uniref:Uncharacterized protein n=1 Tax=Papaver nudicaule TaxID=74823 RepID=A0AA41RZB8_PAPNU|nr:hypothetical protein [Papaver nudicaule]